MFMMLQNDIIYGGDPLSRRVKLNLSSQTLMDLRMGLCACFRALVCVFKNYNIHLFWNIYDSYESLKVIS